MASINQTGAGIRLPNFCNLGVMLRALVIANLLIFASAVLTSRRLADFPSELLVAAAGAEPVLIASLALLCAGRRLLHGLAYIPAIVAVLLLEVGLACAWVAILGQLLPEGPGASLAKAALLAAFATAVVLAYFDLRARAQAPSVALARIEALQARIRPHFLFNSINAVLSLIRSEPKRAERALEDLADLFRVLMADNQALAPLAKEIDIARQYLAIETLRLGPRLRVSWRLEGVPQDALVPALLLQPLVENAVYHGIEPMPGGGEIEVEVRGEGAELMIRLANPVPAAGERHAGSRMALANIRERLQLHFDAEARMESRTAEGTYEVVIRLPYIAATRP